MYEKKMSFLQAGEPTCIISIYNFKETIRAGTMNLRVENGLVAQENEVKLVSSCQGVYYTMYQLRKRSLKFNIKKFKPLYCKTTKLFDITAEKLLTVDDLAHWLNCSKKAIYNLVHYRQIPFLKIGRRLRFRHTEIEKWLKANKGEYYVY
ncbi:MAG: helix-turn-helix domain-containing protein [Pseudomonadota bacterium]